MRLIMLNSVLAAAVLVLVPILYRVPKLDPRWGFLVALGCFMFAAWLLQDFAVRGASDAAVPERIDLQQSYWSALKHTLTHPMWPLALNVFFSLAFTALFVQSKGMAPVPMAVWLCTALVVPVVLTLWRQGWSAIQQTSWDLRIAFILTIVACVFYLRDSFR